jgi:hypothetical protein
MHISRSFFALALVALLVGACGRHEPAPVSANAPIAKHEHHPPHGGTPVVLGQETYHLELVRDASTGRLTAYVLDGEMENFVRVKAVSFDVVASGGAGPRTLTFRAVANPATGETVGDTAQFEAQADWLKAEATFDATLAALEIRSTVFTAVPFNFPKGNDKD